MGAGDCGGHDFTPGLLGSECQMDVPRLAFHKSSKALKSNEAGGKAKSSAEAISDRRAEIIEQIDHGRFEAEALGNEHGKEKKREANDGKTWAVEIGGLHELEKSPCTEERDDDADGVKP